MVVEMKNCKFEVKRVTCLKTIDAIILHYFVIIYLSWNNVTSLV